MKRIQQPIIFCSHLVQNFDFEAKLHYKWLNEFWTKWQLCPKKVISKAIYFYFYSSSELRMIPQPPPPPKMYWVHAPSSTLPDDYHPGVQHQNMNPIRGRYPQSQQRPRPLVTTPLSHHPGAAVAPPTRDQLYNRRSRGIHYITDDSDVWFHSAVRVRIRCGEDATRKVNKGHAL